MVMIFAQVIAIEVGMVFRRSMSNVSIRNCIITILPFTIMHLRLCVATHGDGANPGSAPVPIIYKTDQ